MYSGVNPIALQSQQWIVESLIALMEEKPYQQITIMDICKKADLSRQTFYNVFHQKEDVLRFCLQGEYGRQFQSVESQDSITMEEIVSAFAAVLQKNEKLLSLMIKNNLDTIIIDEIAKCISLFADRFVRNSDKLSQLPYSKAILNGALAYLLLYWFRQDMPIPLSQLMQLISDFLEGKLFTLE